MFNWRRLRAGRFEGFRGEEKCQHETPFDFPKLLLIK
jgi:hypothetical protein